MTARPFRFVVRMTAPSQIRARFRFVGDESKWLKRLAKETRAGMREDGRDERDVPLTIPTLVGYWGRLLTSLNTPRHRRRLSGSEYDVRHSMLPRFQDALGSLLVHHRRRIEDQLATRRPAEDRAHERVFALRAPQATRPGASNQPAGLLRNDGAHKSAGLGTRSAPV